MMQRELNKYSKTKCWVDLEDGATIIVYYMERCDNDWLEDPNLIAQSMKEFIFEENGVESAISQVQTEGFVWVACDDIDFYYISESANLI